ncbi:MAG TPA: phosphoribosylformylglycinamidine synthase subunit PurL [Acidimicrobiia bacterium]|nr:phosphoribosylformylglycinamidine synthase subunit PurL [Acidimicrobiia bacterium]
MSMMTEGGPPPSDPPAPPTEPMHRRLGMNDDEFDSVVGILGRQPTPAELAMYSVMWSEHCSYKSSRSHLGRFPTEAPWVVVGPGENAGVVDIGDGWLAALRIESHNHPSFVEPYQGAATGVGGILRDVFTMGARPIGLWDQIRFGPLDEPLSRYLFQGVVSGIAGYGNAVGVPTVGGEVEFDPCYAGNPLVNVMCLGILHRDQLVLGTAGEPGNIAMLLGNATGRDGIGGASVLASASFDDESGTLRPSVQVGDPFEEKKLIEACLELYDKGLVVGVQDLGAAGLSCATSEPAGRAGVGMDVDLDAVHTREQGMSAAELLMSESQERMMAFVAPDKVDDVIAVATKWEIDSAVVGEVKQGATLTVRHRGEVVAELPAASLSDAAPRNDRPLARPRWMDEVQAKHFDGSDLATASTLLALLSDPAIGSSAWVHEQYDHMLFLNTVVGPGSDASLIRVRGTDKGLAVSTDGNGRLCYLDPKVGAARLVFEAALNVAVTGARPLAVVDNLNFGNPEKPEVMWQFRESVEGISEACEALGIPVVGGNVSFYNETDGVDIHPTPVVGLLGLADPMPSSPPRLGRAEPGMEIWEIGPPAGPNLDGSAVQRLSGELGGMPTAPDPVHGRDVIALAAQLAHRVPVLHDVSDGGAAVAVAEICIASGLGATVEMDNPFSEDPHRFIVVAPRDAAGLPTGARRLGVIQADTITINGSMVAIEQARDAWANAIPRALSAATV